MFLVWINSLLVNMADDKNTGSESDQQVSPQSSSNRDGADANGENLELQELDVPRLQDLANDALSAQSTSLASNEASPRRESSANVRTRRAAVHPQPQPQPASVQSAANQQVPPAAAVNVHFVAHLFPSRANGNSKFVTSFCIKSSA